MELQLPSIISKKGYRIVFCNGDLKIIFRKRDKGTNGKHDFCVYLWRDPVGIGQYIGKGKNEEEALENARMINHRGDMLAHTITKEWICEVLLNGCTSLEAHIAEAYLINHCGRQRAARGQRVGDGVSLINKQKGWDKYERMIEEYLNLDGHNYWEIAGRKINGN